MEQQRNLFLSYPRRRDLPPGWGVILVITLIIGSLSACGGQSAQSRATSVSKHKPGATASPRQVLQQVSPTPASNCQSDTTSSSSQTLQQAGPDSGLYIAHVGDATPCNKSALYKVDYQSGKVLWKYQFKLSHPDRDWGNYAPPFNPIVQQGLVFVESFATDPMTGADTVGSVYAITAATGHLVWSYTFDSRIELGHGQSSNPTYSQGIFYITGIKEKSQDPDAQALYALDASTGKLLRTYTRVTGFAIQNNMLFTSDIDGWPIQAINLKNNQVLWEKDPDGTFAAPFVLQNKVYYRANTQDVVSTNNQMINQYKSSLYAFDPISGQRLWHSPVITTADPVSDVPISDTAYVSALTGDSLSAYDAVTDGRMLWSRKMIFAGGLFVEGNHIYATYASTPIDSAWGYPPQNPYVPGIMSLDSVTGSPIWQRMMTAHLMTDTYSFLTPGFLVHKGILYLNQGIPEKASLTFRTIAMGSDGKVLWQLNLGGGSAEVLVP